MGQGFTQSPIEFQQQCLTLVTKMVAATSARFSVSVPNLNMEQFVGVNLKPKMEQCYLAEMAELDPMHPSMFENSEKRVISNTSLMSEKHWFESTFYTEFIKPNGYMHVCDMFIKHRNQIIAVVTLLRSASLPSFSSQELLTFDKLQPSIEYFFNSVCMSSHFSERAYFQEQYHLTNREVDVMEQTLTGANNKILCQRLKMSLPTLRTHLQRIYLKADVHSTSELIAKVLRSLPKNGGI